VTINANTWNDVTAGQPHVGGRRSR